MKGLKSRRDASRALTLPMSISPPRETKKGFHSEGRKPYGLLIFWPRLSNMYKFGEQKRHPFRISDHQAGKGPEQSKPGECKGGQPFPFKRGDYVWLLPYTDDPNEEKHLVNKWYVVGHCSERYVISRYDISFVRLFVVGLRFSRYVLTRNFSGTRCELKKDERPQASQFLFPTTRLRAPELWYQSPTRVRLKHGIEVFEISGIQPVQNTKKWKYSLRELGSGKRGTTWYTFDQLEVV